MFDVKELFSKKNQKKAIAFFERKTHFGAGQQFEEFKNFWQLNQESIIEQIEQGSYQPELVSQRDYLKKSGGKRRISTFASQDRFILRLLSQKLTAYFDRQFQPNSCAYQEGKGVTMTVSKARDFILSGLTSLVEIDLHQYFDTIPLDRLLAKLEQYQFSQEVLQLIKSYLYCQVSYQGEFRQQDLGLIQGSAISPVLSNLYLHDFDTYLENKGLNWLRFADNIYLFCQSQEEGQLIFQELTSILEREYGLTINRKKSGVYKAINRRMLGYDFLMVKGQLICQKHQYQQMTCYRQWQTSGLRMANHQYYIIESGILTRRDYALLFENEEQKQDLPLAGLEQLNVYSDLVISPQVLSLLSQHRIPLVIHDSYGSIQSYLIPETMASSAPIVLAQAELYLNEARRLEVARAFELAHFHNLRANCRYYLKKLKGNSVLLDLEEFISQAMVAVRQKKSVDDLLLLEARVRQQYYQLFNQVVNQEGFAFVRRSKRPPQDPLNALLSFCNTVLYGQVLRMIWKARLDPKLPVLHAANQRPYSLQLDFADYMKPVLVDRVILSLINKHQISAALHFDLNEDSGAVLLNQEGKRIVIRALEEKFSTRLVVNETSYTYRDLISRDVVAFKKYLQKDPMVKRFKPYKYY